MMWPIFNRLAAPRYGLILLYHSVLESVPTDLEEGIHNVCPKLFAAQIDWLARHFEVISVDAFLGLDDVAGKAAITFDDAYRSVFETALPLLKQQDLPATVFVNTKSVDGKPFWRDKIRYLINNRLVGDFLAFRRARWPDGPELDETRFYRQSKTVAVNSIRLDQQIDVFAKERALSEDIRALAGHIASPAEFVDDPLVAYGNHTHSHFLLSSLNAVEQAMEIRKNDVELNRLALPLSEIFAFPFGDLGDFNDETVAILRQDGYAGAVLSRHRVNAAKRTDGFFAERWMPPNDMRLFHRRLAGMCVRAMKGDQA